MVAAGGCAGAVDDAALDEAAEDEAGEHQQRRDDEGAVDLVDLVLVVDEVYRAGWTRAASAAAVPGFL